MLWTILTTSLCLAIGPLPSDVVQYDGTVFPQQAGWTPLSNGTPEISLTDGLLVQTFDAPGDQEFYNRSIGEFSGSPTFFTEWRMQTNVPSSSLGTLDVRAALVLFGNGVSYHFRFTDSEALFTRFDNSLFFYEIQPNVLHTYRIELLDDDSYRFLIDGTVVDSGAQPGPYPTSASQIVWGARYFAPSQTTEWDYVTLGSVPEPTVASLLIVGATLLVLRRRPADCLTPDLLADQPHLVNKKLK